MSSGDKLSAKSSRRSRRSSPTATDASDADADDAETETDVRRNFGSRLRVFAETPVRGSQEIGEACPDFGSRRT